MSESGFKPGMSQLIPQSSSNWAMPYESRGLIHPANLTIILSGMLCESEQ